MTGDYRRSGDSQQQTRSNIMVVGQLFILNLFSLNYFYFKDSGHPNNETKPFVLVDELHLINKNLNTLDQLLNQRMTRLLQSGLPTSNDELILLYQEHKVRLYTSKSSTHFPFFFSLPLKISLIEKVLC